ncbi:MAG: hypothetical protein HYX76_09640 [Acidobacteria bacterium]|nr:hypothetical protein [Acidobacteriota bacterium]
MIEGTETECGGPVDVGPLFHRLNNQLGIILANAELMESKSADAMMRTRAEHVITSVLEALNTARLIRSSLQSPPSTVGH